MKGLLLKDVYMTVKYCKAYLLIAAVFIACSFASDAGINNMFFIFYPCLLCGMIPLNLLGYDERSRWMQYSGTLPYSKTQIVSSKYLIGLFAQTAMLTVIGISQAIRMSINGGFQLDDFIVLILMLFIMSMISPSITLPLVFKLGVEKGRIAYYVMLGVLFAVIYAVSGIFAENLQTDIQLSNILAILCLVGIGIYAFSWYLSIVFYKKREIQ